MDIKLLDRLLILGLFILLVQLLLLCSLSKSSPVEEGSSEEAVERKALGQNEFLLETEAELKSKQTTSSSSRSTPVKHESQSKRTLDPFDQNELSYEFNSLKMTRLLELLEEVEANFLRTWTINERLHQKAEKWPFLSRLVWIQDSKSVLTFWPGLSYFDLFAIYCDIHRFYF